QRKLLRLEAVLTAPVVNILSGNAFAAVRAIDVAEREREIDHLLTIDPIHDIIRGHVHCLVPELKTMPFRNIAVPS
ncbi:MAG: hypothetical protein AB7U62_15990, partial [Pseudolabrys sp.]